MGSPRLRANVRLIRLLLRLPETPPKQVTLEGEPFHYLVHVLRLKVGDPLEVFDGEGHRFQARVTSLEKTAARLDLEQRLAPGSESAHLTLAQSIPKGDKWEWVLQKGTELGVSAFMPLVSARGVVKVPEGRLSSRMTRWAKIIEEAARQCGRSDVPLLFPPMGLEGLRAQLAPETQLLVLDEEERDRALGREMSRGARVAPWALAIGPEGGWERSEIAGLSDRGGIPVTLGTQVLRAETAAVAALSIALHHLGNLG